MWKHLSVLFVLSLAIVACSKVSDDETDPVLTQYTISPEVVEVGEQVSVSVSCTDNEELRQIRIRIQEAFSKSFGAWKVLRVDDISGRSFTGVYQFTVPDSALAGYYSVAVQASDERGNGTIDSVLYFTIDRPDQAPSLIDFETNPPIQGNVIELELGDTLSFSGTAFDADSLSSIEIDLLDVDGSGIEGLTYNIGDTTNTFSFDNQADSLFIDYQEDIPGRLLIKVTDSEGHLLRESFEIDYQF